VKCGCVLSAYVCACFDIGVSAGRVSLEEQ